MGSVGRQIAPNLAHQARAALQLLCAECNRRKSDSICPEPSDRRGTSALCGLPFRQPVRRRDYALLRYAEVVATALDKDKLHDVLDQAVIVIDERDLERSRRDPRVRAFHESADQLLAELEAEGADYC